MEQEHIKAIEGAYLVIGSLAKTPHEFWPSAADLQASFVGLAEDLRRALDALTDGKWVGGAGHSSIS